MARPLALTTAVLTLLALYSGGCSAVDPDGNEEGEEQSESPLVGYGGASGSTTSGSTAVSSSGSTSSSTAASSGTGGQAASPCTCPFDPKTEYLPNADGAKNDCPNKTTRPVCENAFCTVAKGDPNDDQLDLWELRHCSWPVEPLPEPGSKPCRCPFGISGKNERITKACPDSSSKQSCELWTCTVEVWDKPGDYAKLEIRDCGWNG